MLLTINIALCRILQALLSVVALTLVSDSSLLPGMPLFHHDRGIVMFAALAAFCAALGFEPVIQSLTTRRAQRSGYRARHFG